MRTTQEKIQPLSWVEIDLRAIARNLKELRRLAARNETRGPSDGRWKRMEILAVIKADAYGHGSREVGLLLEARGVGFFGVSDIAEGISLREAGIKKPMLLLEAALPSLAPYILDYDLIPTVNSLALASSFNRYARRVRKRMRIHIKVDTGMGRLGVWHEEAFEFIKRVNQFKHLTIHGLYTHFPSADTDKGFTRQQLDIFYALIQRLDQEGLVISYIHAANSMGLAGYQTRVLNLARPGLMLYGLHPAPEVRNDVRLQPAMSVKSRIIYLKKVKKGRSISYGRTFIAGRDMTVATLPLGYNDGYLRGFSGKASVLVEGIRCPVIGRVTMDQIMVDVSKVVLSGSRTKHSLRLGLPVTILGSQKDQTISADELARHGETINYEIVCLLGNRLPRVYKK
ncbi:MAG TPA: alanine racemase [Candidatus Omnitrophica bacterium]|nr:MAG: alanine racemase [Omnitrophica WOR_2 bacterium GWA2_45_18]HBR14912.1 alanine racemase [Candidatus Omnitrophota bacterium]